MEPSESTSTAAAEPRWVMLNRYSCPEDDVDYVIADAKTVADSYTSAGRHFRVSFGIAAPPALSYIYCDDTVGIAAAASVPEKTGHLVPQVVAAHGDSVLLNLEDDYFVYRAGVAAASGPPPSLSLLPASGRRLTHENTSILSRGKDELLVVKLCVPYREDEIRRPRDTAELRVLRAGNDDWKLYPAVPIVHDKDGGGVGGLPYSWEAVAAVPVGDRYMCWANYLSGFLVCDMVDMTTTNPQKLRYVRLPAALTDDDDEDDDDDYLYDDYETTTPTQKCARNMCAAGACSLRLVSVDPRCCCGGPGSSSCRRSRHAFTVTTWTLTLRADGAPMVWVREGVLDNDELWALPEYGSLPRFPLEYPIVSSDDPDVVCFTVRNCRGYREDSKTWTVEVNTRSKTQQSVLPRSIFDPWEAESIITAKLHC